MGKNHYPHVFLEQCKYIKKEKTVTKYIANSLQIWFDESDESDKE